MRRKQA